MTEPATTPVFRHFPWIQLVFCLACLTMTAWTWMRYSYAWAVKADVLMFAYGTEAVGQLADAYVCVQGDNAPLEVCLSLDEQPGLATVSIAERGQTMLLATVRGEVNMRYMTVSPTPSGPYHGRVSFEDLPIVDTTASRFHGASIAGIVVGAMGCFIFGLYLRAWLRERKALASEPQQDMIA